MRRVYWKIGAVIALTVQGVLAASSPFEGGFWAGVEVTGGASLEEVAYVRSLVPIKEGAPFTGTLADQEAWCNIIREAIPQKQALCSYFFLGSGERYFAVHITSKDQKLPYRAIPFGPVDVSLVLPKPLLKIGSDLATRYNDWNVNTTEFCSQGHTDYSDPVLHDLSIQLAKLVPFHQETLFHTLQYSHNVEDRYHAAYLLGWTQDPNILKKVVEFNLLKDPEAVVRNYVARSLYCIIPEVKDIVTIKQAVGTFCELAQFPETTDQNKGLVGLYKLLKEHPQARFAPDNICRSTIHDFAQMSIIRSIGGVAKRIQPFLQEEG